MNKAEILREIAYLDDNLAEAPASGEMVALLRDAIQIELAKQGYLRRAEDVSARIASLEERVEALRRVFIKQQVTPAVIYIRGQGVISSLPAEPRRLTTAGHFTFPTPSPISPPAEPKLPVAMVAFYGLGLGCSLVFATLLGLSAVKVDTIHPFISLLGLAGGLGWLTTAWTDLLLWKRGKLIGNRTAKTEERPAISA